METDIHPSSPTVAGECFVLQRRSCCCCSKRKAASMLFSLPLFCCCFFAFIFFLYFLSRIIKTISLYDETFTDPLQLPNRTPDQLLGLQLLYRKQTDLYAWKKESSNQKYQIYKQTTWDISPVERHRVHSTAFIIKLSVYRYNC